MRTNASFRDKLQRGHHHSKSLLERLVYLDMVRDIPLDSMHVVYLGVMRKLLRSWVKGKYVRGVRLSSPLIAKLSKFLEFMARFITANFARKSRSLDELCYFKATEFRLFCLYLGPIVLRDNLSEELYSHFLLLHVAIKLLSDKVHCRVSDVIEYCKDLLYFFVRDCSKLYGKDLYQSMSTLLFTSLMM